MDARRIGRLAGDVRRFTGLFDDCFARSEGREHLQRYVRGQLSNVRRKCVEPMADAFGMAPRTLQDFLATHTWDHQRALDRLQELVAEAHLCEEAIGLIDETSFPKRGDKTAGVQRQYCGATGKIDNCVVTVGLGYADLRGQFRCTLDHPYLGLTILTVCSLLAGRLIQLGQCMLCFLANPSFLVIDKTFECCAGPLVIQASQADYRVPLNNRVA